MGQGGEKPPPKHPTPNRIKAAPLWKGWREGTVNSSSLEVLVFMFKPNTWLAPSTPVPMFAFPLGTTRATEHWQTDPGRKTGPKGKLTFKTT